MPSLDDFAAQIDEWHTAPEGSEAALMSLHEYLGLTWEQYKAMVDPADEMPLRLTRLLDGRVMCCICFEYKRRGELWVDDDGALTDLCKRCAITEVVR